MGAEIYYICIQWSIKCVFENKNNYHFLYFLHRQVNRNQILFSKIIFMRDEILKLILCLYVCKHYIKLFSATLNNISFRFTHNQTVNKSKKTMKIVCKLVKTSKTVFFFKFSFLLSFRAIAHWTKINICFSSCYFRNNLVSQW